MTSDAHGAGGPGEVFLANLERIERIVDSICRRNGIVGDEADDLRSWLCERLIDNDYAVFRKYGGRSSIGTYLVAVLANLFRDYRIQQWGKWRPSAVARRIGPIGVRLERLLHRDGHSVREAIEVIRSTATDPPGDADLARMAARLPVRKPRGPDPALPRDLPATGSTDDTVHEHDRQRTRIELEEALEVALGEMDAEDVLILKLRFWEGHTVADIARTLHIDQKSLYPRIQKMMPVLRARLEAQGIGAERVAELLAEP